MWRGFKEKWGWWATVLGLDMARVICQPPASASGCFISAEPFGSNHWMGCQPVLCAHLSLDNEPLPSPSPAQILAALLQLLPHLLLGQGVPGQLPLVSQLGAEQWACAFCRRSAPGGCFLQPPLNLLPEGKRLVWDCKGRILDCYGLCHITRAH